MAKAARRSRTRGRPVRRSRVRPASKSRSRVGSRSRSNKKRRRSKKRGGELSVEDFGAKLFDAIKERETSLFVSSSTPPPPSSGLPPPSQSLVKPDQQNLPQISMSEYIKNLTPEGYSKVGDINFPEITFVLPNREQTLSITNVDNTITIPIYILTDIDTSVPGLENGKYRVYNLILTNNNSDSVSSFNVDLKRLGSEESTSEQFPITLTFEKSP
jgi:hypothetical protein